MVHIATIERYISQNPTCRKVHLTGKETEIFCVWKSLFPPIDPLTQAWQKGPKTVSCALDSLRSAALILMRGSLHYGRPSNLLSSSEVVQYFLLTNTPRRQVGEGNSNLTFRRLQHRSVLHPKYISGTPRSPTYLLNYTSPRQQTLILIYAYSRTSNFT